MQPYLDKYGDNQGTSPELIAWINPGYGIFRGIMKINFEILKNLFPKSGRFSGEIFRLHSYSHLHKMKFRN